MTPDPNPRVLDSDATDVRAAVADGLEVYAFEGATHWLGAQGLRFERTDVARQPFAAWIGQQPRGTLVVAAAAGRGLPFEWLPIANRSQSARPSNYGALILSTGGESNIEQSDAGVVIQRAIGSEGRAVTIASSDEGPRIMWGDDVLAAIDRGLAVAAFTPAGALIGSWAFSLDEMPGVQRPPTPFVLRGEVPCEVLRPGLPTDVTGILSDGSWLATVEGKGRAVITLDTPVPSSGWRHRVSNGRGEASVDAQGSRLMLDPVPATRSVFRFTMTPGQKATATLEPGDITAVRVCQAAIPALPAAGSLDVTADRDASFGPGWHLGERGGTQRFRWSQRESSLMWRMEKPAPVRMLLHLRAANSKGATIQAAINGTPLPACPLPAGAWTDCKIEVPETAAHSGINQLTLSADTVSPSADRPGDARELAFAMQASPVRISR